MAVCQCLKTNGSRCTRSVKLNSLYCWQHQNCQVIKGEKVKQKGGSPPKISFPIANFNVCNHLHLNKFTKFTESEEATLNRYIYSIHTLLNFVNFYQIKAVSLSEVTNEYYDAFQSLLKSDIKKGDIKLTYEGKSLMTVFFGVDKVEQVPVAYHPERDRLQIFNLSIQSDDKNFYLTYINIHGYGLPEIREKYLNNNLLYINELRKAKLIFNEFVLCGDFNSDYDQVDKVLKQAQVDKHFAKLNFYDVNLYRDFRSTSYHRYILTSEGQFEDKPKAIWYSKMDHLLYTNALEVSNLLIFPTDFTKYEHPYQMVKGVQKLGVWPSDHTLNIYQMNVKLI